MALFFFFLAHPPLLPRRPTDPNSVTGRREDVYSLPRNGDLFFFWELKPSGLYLLTRTVVGGGASASRHLPRVGGSVAGAETGETQRSVEDEEGLIFSIVLGARWLLILIKFI